jgi:hypothetical protein
MFRRNIGKDAGFPQMIRNALDRYDHEKSIRRSIFGEHPSIAELRKLPLEKRRDLAALAACFDDHVLTEKQASYKVYTACMELILEQQHFTDDHEDLHTPIAPHVRKEKVVAQVAVISEQHTSLEHPLRCLVEESALACIHRLRSRYRKNKNVNAFIRPAHAFSEQEQVQINHDYFAGLIKDRIICHMLLQDEQHKKDLKQAATILTEKPYDTVMITDNLTFCQLLFLLDHAANDMECTNIDDASFAFYEALGQLLKDTNPDIGKLVGALAGHHPDVPVTNPHQATHDAFLKLFGKNKEGDSSKDSAAQLLNPQFIHK